MQKSNTTAIAGVIIFGILAVGLTFYALTRKGAAPVPTNANATNASADTQTPAPPKNYYVATRQILPRTRITSDMLVEHQNDGHPVPANAITDPAQVLGQLANSIIEPGQIVTAGSTTNAVARVIPANIPVPVGLRAVAIWVNPDETAAGLVDVGDRVDVITTQKLTGTTALKGNVNFVSGRTIAQDLQVLAVDKSINAPPPGAPKPDDKADKTNNNNQPPPTPDSMRTRVILAATAQQAQRLAAANESGTLDITIRNPGDSIVLPTGEALEYPVHLISTKTPAPASAPAPAPERNRNARPAPYFPTPAPQAPLPPSIPSASGYSSGHDVTVIRGTTKSQVEVPK